ncbi:MAG TPA: spore coat U domain-containing protein [Geminicoccaceae bacterium]|nr:spore coat U domain-containing protein [Geminicoccaceae bacterium]
MLRRLLVVASALAAALVPLPAKAGTDTDQLTVTATVLSSCSLSGGTLNFGQYISGQQTDLDVTGTINYVNCSGNLTFALDGGGAGSVNARQMSSGANRLNYQIYRNPTRSAVWGSGADAQGVTLIGTQSGTVSVHGRIPKNQVVPDGTYTDVVNITLTF